MKTSKRKLSGNAVGQVGNKFRVAPVDQRTSDGIVFDSKLERRFYEVICQHLPEHQVTRQVLFTLQPSFRTTHDGHVVRAIHYRADFVFGPLGGTPEDPRPLPGSVVVDAKGMLTPVFALASKMFQHRFGKPVLALKTLKSLVATIEQYKKINNMNQILKDRAADGQPFTIHGYRRSDGSVVDLKVRFLPRDGYLQLVRKSLDQLIADPSCISLDAEAAAMFSVRDTEQARAEVALSLQQSLMERDSEENKPARVSHETLVPVSDNLALLNGHETHVVAFRLETLDTRVVVPSEKPALKPRSAVGAIKRLMMRKLPLSAYCHRLNLYDGNYESIK